MEFSERRIQSVQLSQGLWTNVPDLDAVRILSNGDLNGQAKTRLTVSDYNGNFTVDSGQFLTVCSMNLGCTRDIVPTFILVESDSILVFIRPSNGHEMFIVCCRWRVNSSP